MGLAGTSLGEGRVERLERTPEREEKTMKPMAAAMAGALISGVAMFAVGARAAQNDAFVESPALVQTLDGQYLAPAAQPRAQFVSTAPTRVVRTAARSRPVYRTAERPAAQTQTVYRDDVQVEEVRPE